MTLSRRDFLAAMAATTLTGCASNLPAGRRYSKVIDAHAHWYPREFVTLLEKEGPQYGAKMGKTPQGYTFLESVPGGTQSSIMPPNMNQFSVRAFLHAHLMAELMVAGDAP
jgi:hypothetical protein